MPPLKFKKKCLELVGFDALTSNSEGPSCLRLDYASTMILFCPLEVSSHILPPFNLFSGSACVYKHQGGAIQLGNSQLEYIRML